MLTPTLKSCFFYAGVLLIALSALILITTLSGLLDLPETILGGEHTLHSIARLAVVGCALAAIGSWEQTPFK